MLELPWLKLDAVVKPERPDEVRDAPFPLDVPTVGMTVGGDNIGVPGLTEGICHTVPPGKTVIGMVDELLVPKVTTVEVVSGVVRVVKELIIVGIKVSTTVVALAVPPAPATIEVTTDAPGGMTLLTVTDVETGAVFDPGGCPPLDESDDFPLAVLS